MVWRRKEESRRNEIVVCEGMGREEELKSRIYRIRMEDSRDTI
jgi:hypothetical protein